MCVCSGHPGSIRGAVHPNRPREQKEDQAHRQRHQPKMERDLQLHIRPQPTERPGGWTFISQYHHRNYDQNLFFESFVNIHHCRTS